MRVYVNGKETEVAEKLTLTELLEQRELNPGTVVVERNMVIVPKDEWPNLQLLAEDKLEIVSFVGGG